MKEPSKQQAYTITVLLSSKKTKTITVKASSREVAIRRALKRESNAIGVLVDSERTGPS